MFDTILPMGTGRSDLLLGDGLDDSAATYVADLVTAASAICATDLTTLPPQQLGTLLQRMEGARAVVDAAANAVLDRFDADGAAGFDGLRSTTSWLTHRCQMTGAAASRRVRTARKLREMPEVADGFRSGRFSADQADLFARVHNPRTAEAMGEDEHALAALADQLRPDELGRELRGWAEMVDTDGAEPDPGHQGRGFSMVQTLDDSWTGRLDLGSADGLFLNAAVEAMSEMLFREHDAGAAVAGDAERTGDAADPPTPSRRTPTQRRSDALVELVRRGCEGGPAAASRPDGTKAQCGGTDGVATPSKCSHQPRVKVALHLLLDAGDLEAGRGADTLDGHHLTPGGTDRLLCDSAITAVLRDPFGGAVLDMGRNRRVVTPAQWAALAIRDGGCSFPGCAAPPQDCDAHHIVHWRNGGPTNLDNLTLTCWATHHKAVHEDGWQVVADQHGPPTWYRPDATLVEPRVGWSSSERPDLPEQVELARAPSTRARPAPRRLTIAQTPPARPDPDLRELVAVARERAHALRAERNDRCGRSHRARIG